MKVKELCPVTVNLRNLPNNAWKKCNNGQFYEASYQLALVFGADLTMKVMYEGKDLGMANALYQ